MHSSKLFLEASVLLLCWALVQATPAAQQTLDDSDEAQERLFFSIVPQLCLGTSGKGGVCRSSLKCALRGQVGDGRCGWLNFGVCCVDRTISTPTSCDVQTSAQEYTFRNPSYPNPETADLGSCAVTVTTASNTCQLRLDLNEFTLADPDNEGVCLDYLEVSGSSIPKICGENAGQHLYVIVEPDTNVTIDVVTPSGGGKWDIKVTQIACASDEAAPSGCLQYYRTPTGTISSFNYNPSSDQGTRQLADQSYFICIAELSGYCSVSYTQAAGSSFSLNGDPQAVAPGTTGAPLYDYFCRTDYLLVYSTKIDDNSNFADPKPTTAGRICGLSFPDITDVFTPFSIKVVTNGDEVSDGDSNNEGFQLSYTMNACEGK